MDNTEATSAPEHVARPAAHDIPSPKPSRAPYNGGRPVVSRRKGKKEYEHLKEIGCIYVQLLTAMKTGGVITAQDAFHLIDPKRDQHTCLCYLHDLVERGFAHIEKRFPKRQYGEPEIYFGLKNPLAELPQPEDFYFSPCVQTQEREKFEAELLAFVKKRGIVTVVETHAHFPDRGRSTRTLRQIFSDMERKGLIRIERIRCGPYPAYTNFYSPE
jgi:hypothetical protein